MTVKHENHREEIADYVHTDVTHGICIIAHSILFSKVKEYLAQEQGDECRFEEDEL